jgi:hypothetical protein
MISSREEAALLLNNWREEMASLNVTALGGTFSVLSLTGWLVEVSAEPFALEVRTTDGVRLVVDLRGATFTYADAAEAPSAVRGRARGRFRDLLEAALPNGDRCAFVRLRGRPSIASD